MSMAEPFLTASDVARLLQVHIETVYILVAKHSLPAAKIGRRWRFEEQKVRAWFEAHYATLDEAQDTLNHKES
jgi:excisionase family DNA binding protein